MRARLAWALALATLVASAAPAVAVLCESYEQAACAGRVTSSGECGWREGRCVVIAPLPPGKVAVTAVGARQDEPSFAVTSAAEPTAPAAPGGAASACTDQPTPEGFTCEQQKAWGKCAAMDGWGDYCAATCGRCQAPAGEAPAPQLGLQGAAVPATEASGGRRVLGRRAGMAASLCSSPPLLNSPPAALPTPLTQGPTDSAFCTQPAVAGPCRAAIRSWFYDATRRACSPFLFGGCQGNDNNFPSNDACEAAAQRFCGA